MLLILLVLVCGTVIVDKHSKNHLQVMSSIMLLFNTLIPLSIQFFYNTASVLISQRLSKKLNISDLLVSCDKLLDYLNSNLDIEMCKDIDTLGSFDTNFIPFSIPDFL